MQRKSNFDQRQAEERIHNARWDSFFSTWYFVLQSPLELDLLGIDRVFVNRATFETTLVEYKNDSRAAQTGRAFIEDCENTRLGSPGWIHRCHAQKIIISVPPQNKLYVCSADTLKARFPEWKNQYGIREASNLRHIATGVCVPLSIITEIADAVLAINQ